MKKFIFWKAKKADPTLSMKSVGLWLATVATTMVVTWLLAPAKKQECCKETETAKNDEEPVVEEAEDVSEDVSEAESEEVPEEESEEEPKEESEGESTDESEEVSKKEKLKESFKRFRGAWKKGKKAR